jgi:hypothetical protein
VPEAALPAAHTTIQTKTPGHRFALNAALPRTRNCLTALAGVVQV